MMITIRYCLLALVMGIFTPAPLMAAQPTQGAEGYVARQESLRGFFEMLSAPLGKPIIVSKTAAKRTVTGNFALSEPQKTLERISRQMGLIWYSDGQSIYLYEAAEAKRAVISLNTITVAKLESFLRRSGLLDARYPLRTDGQRTLYVAGPPIYVDLVSQAAAFMDSQSADLQLGQQRIGVIQLRNTFVGDRQYEMREEKILVPGMATVIEQLLSGEQRGVDVQVNRVAGGERPLSMPPFPGENAPDAGATATTARAMARDLGAGNIRIVAYPDTNSLLVKGLPEQVRFIENLVAALDESKRHVELSVWIVDLLQDDLNQLGVNWQGGVRVGSQFEVSLNRGSVSTQDAVSFLAAVSALEQQDRARVVSRPVVLTQENVPAIFDNNRTFYAPLVGERAVDLQQVTYGTLVSVLPRIGAANDIEMVLNIEDGSEVDNPRSNQDDQDANLLPTVGRTRISTVARVPHGKSLLVGGFTRDETSQQTRRIPVLGHIPFVGRLFSYKQTHRANTARVFLIQPREIHGPLADDADRLASEVFDERTLSEQEKAVYRSLER
ncbi:type III secretion system outer membrane ring subunit SctC [Pseudomonas typographi]